MSELYSILAALALKSVAVLIAATAVQALLRRAPAAVRHLVWTVALMAILALPAGPLAARWFALDATGPAASVLRAATTTITVTPEGELPWRELLAGLWLAVALILSARLAVATAAAARIRSRSRDLGVAGTIPVRASDEIASPVALGVLNPVILVPAEAAQWPSDRRRMVLLHEAAHVERGDLWAHLAAEAAKIVYWFNPLVWFAAARLEDERERACDDLVLAAGEDACSYADHLIGVARSMRPELAAPGIPMAAPSRLESRLRAILDRTVRRAGITRGAMAAAAVVTLAFSLPLAVLRAQSDKALSGRIFDASGATVPGAQVSLRQLGGELTETVVTDGSGDYAFASLPPGPYLLSVRKPGFAQAMLFLPLEANQPVRKNITLRVGEINERVQVEAERPVNATPKPGHPMRLRVGSNVQASQLISKIQPRYPSEAKLAGIAGTVSLDIVVLKDGSVGSIQVTESPDASLAAAAVDAVRQWIYRPTLLNGEPVEVISKVDVNFTLKK